MAASGITRDLVTMATQSITTGGCDMDDDGDGSQGTAEHNFIPPPSTSPEPVPNLPCNQKQIKSRPYTSKEVLPQKLVHVGALEVQNVKRAINRYGTLPKGARIGAYLESLRQSGLPSNQENVVPVVAAAATLSTAMEQQQQQENAGAVDAAPQHRSLSPRQNNLRSQPQMTRSNSSSGVVNTYQPPNSPRSRAVAVRKNNVDSGIGLRTFRAPNNSSFRTASPSRSIQPTLADLEFPPPPVDLPPPPDEAFGGGSNDHQCDLPPPVSALPCAEAATTTPHKTTTINTTTASSPVGIRKLKAEWRSKDEVSDEQQEDRNSGDVRNSEPSVKEASSRFGVNLRRRDISSDAHCLGVGKSGGGGTDEKKLTYHNRPKELAAISSQMMIPATKIEPPPPPPPDAPNAPPEEAPPPPPPPPPPIGGSADTFESKPGMKEMLELKLINEIKQSADMKHGGAKKTGAANNAPSSAAAPLDPASQLLSELCASFSMDSANRQHQQQQQQQQHHHHHAPVSSEYAITTLRGTGDLMFGGVLELHHSSGTQAALDRNIGGHREIPLTSPITEGVLSATNVGFKLKKVDKRTSNVPREENSDGQQIIDFKARLRKVDNNADKERAAAQEQQEKSRRHADDAPASAGGVADSTESSGADDPNDDKRRSTGSISSLKKLWENKEASCDNQPLSPKLNVRGPGGKQQEVAGDAGEDSPEDHSGASTRSSASKDDPRIWPPPPPPSSLSLSSSTAAASVTAATTIIATTATTITTTTTTTTIGTTTSEVEKPIVPAKPLKPLGPSSKHFGSSIYATPNCNKPSSAQQQADDDSGVGGGGKQAGGGGGGGESAKGAKHSVLEISNVIENSILNLKGSPTIVMASWLQLSDKVGLLHGMCVNLTDTAIAPHARFQFRDLLTRLELQARQLRAAGTRNITENTRLLSDVQNTIKDVINTVQR